MRCLLELLRGESVDRLIDEAEWEAVLALAEEEHVLPYAAARMRSRQGSLMPAISARLDQIERDAAIAAFYWSSELKGVLRAFGQREIRVVPLKGPFLADRLYGATALRVSRDLDLLVAKADLARADAVLTAIGFVPGDRDDYHRPWYRETTTVELHYDVENPLAFDFDVGSALLGLHPAVFLGECCWQLAPDDELLFLCLHAARHRFERLSLIVDLQLAFEKLPVIASGWQPRPEVAGLSSLLRLGLAMARRLQPDIAVSVTLSGSRKQAEYLEMLADRLWTRLLTESSEALDWRAVHSFFLEIESPGWPRLRRRRRHLQILLSRVIAPDYVFAAQFGLHRDWQVYMLRPLRLLSEAIWPLRGDGRRAG
jgi:hypothetical protein